jgi:hypothetical protein
VESRESDAGGRPFAYRLKRRGGSWSGCCQSPIPRRREFGASVSADPLWLLMQYPKRSADCARLRGALLLTRTQVSSAVRLQRVYREFASSDNISGGSRNEHRRQQRACPQ